MCCTPIYLLLSLGLPYYSCSKTAFITTEKYHLKDSFRLLHLKFLEYCCIFKSIAFGALIFSDITLTQEIFF